MSAAIADRRPDNAPRRSVVSMSLVVRMGATGALSPVLGMGMVGASVVVVGFVRTATRWYARAGDRVSRIRPSSTSRRTLPSTKRASTGVCRRISSCASCPGVHQSTSGTAL
jgi:hypothetical protein